MVQKMQMDELRVCARVSEKKKREETKGKKLRAKQKGLEPKRQDSLKNFVVADSALLPALFRNTGLVLPGARVPHLVHGSHDLYLSLSCRTQDVCSVIQREST